MELVIDWVIVVRTGPRGGHVLAAKDGSKRRAVGSRHGTSSGCSAGSMASHG
jgi:hypothetical protein